VGQTVVATITVTETEIVVAWIVTFVSDDGSVLAETSFLIATARVLNPAVL
jgi:hypothetical protein